ncbi:MAG: ATP-binding protein, partial [Bacteroidota bacterium]
SELVNGQVRLTVSDNGIGIDLDKHGAKLFGLYQRFHSHIEGKGLGLYIVKSQLEALGGRVEVQSEPDKGTMFHVYFEHNPN